jgi:hypothetical protein
VPLGCLVCAIDPVAAARPQVLGPVRPGDALRIGWLQGETPVDTESPKPASISLDDLTAAFEFVSAGQKFENHALICTNTGSIYYRSVLTGENDFPDDVDESDHSISVPHKNDLDLGRDLVFAFVDEHLPNQSNAVRDMFRSKGAYRRFRDMLESRGMQDKWYAFEETATKQALRAWCEEVGIQLEDPPASTAAR